MEKISYVTYANDIIENHLFHEPHEEDEEQKVKLKKTNDFTDAGDISDNNLFYEWNSFTSSIDNEFNSHTKTDNDFSNYLDKIMLPASKLSVRCIILMYLAFALRFKLSVKAVSQLVKTLILFVGP